MKNIIITILAVIVFSGCGTTSNTVTRGAKPDGKDVYTISTGTEEVAQKHFRLGHKYRSQGKLELSAQEFELAYNSLSSSDPSYAKGSLANEYGLALIKIERYIEARSIIEKALEYNKISNDKMGVAVSLMNLGDTYSRSGDKEAAVPYYKQAFEVSEEVKDPYLRAAILGRF